MYNLNYNVTNARLNRPVGRPFVPFGRPDPYSASLVLAIPGAIFRQGYINVFNQTNEFDDISGYLKGGSVFNPNTGKYTTPFVSHTLTPTGSVGFITGSTTVNQFSAQGYNTSLIVSGNTALNVTPLSSSLGTDFNLSKDTPWCMEAWFAYDQTASAIPSNGSPTASIWYGNPNKQWIGHWFTDNPTGSSYIAYAGWSGRTDGFNPPPPLTLVSGSPAFYYDSSTHGGNPDYRINSTDSSTIVPFVMQHTAITCYPSASVGKLNMYINGIRVGGGDITAEIALAPATLITILGNASPNTGSVVNAINNSNYATGSGLFAQDVRLYNGAAKYTGSSFTPPPSMIVGQNEPYPQYQ
jgi:hypothetical protein